MPDIVSAAAALGLGQVAGALSPLVAGTGFGLLHLYLVFLVIGGGYAAVAFFFSSMGGDHDVSAGHDVEVGHDFGAEHGMDVEHGGDFDHGVETGHDLGHETGHGAEHGELAVADGSMTQLGPFSPMIVAMFFAFFGASGMLFTGVIPLSYLSLLPSVALAFGGAWLFMSGINKIFAATEASSEAEAWRLVGREAQVITPIPQDGVGEIQYQAKGSTFSAPARTQDGTPAGRATMVTIIDSSRTIFTVKKSVEERFRDLERGS